MKVIDIKSDKIRIKKVKNIIKSAGNQIASVWFNKRKDGKLRKMAFRLHTSKPTYAPKPTGKNHLKRVARDSDNMLMTVFDVNKVLYRKGKIAGRGAWRSIPLENVKRVCVKGTIYKIKS